jgi:predicted dehydrogenase
MPMSSSVARCAGVSEVALADVTGETFEKIGRVFAKVPRPLVMFRDVSEMLGRHRPQLVVITLEAHRSPAAIRAALEAGCHVLAEKPACARLEEFAPLVALAGTRSRHLMLALTSRLNPAVRKAAEIVRSGALGRLYSAAMVYISDQTRLRGPAYRGTWLASRATAGGGDLALHGIHEIDVVQFVTGRRIRRVTGFSRNVGGQPIDVEDCNGLALEFDGGMFGTLQSGYYLDRGYQDSLTLWGSEGWLRFTQPAPSPLEWVSYGSRGGSIQTYAPPETDGWLDTLQAAVDAARGTAPPFITGDDCHSVLKAIFGLYRAARTGVVQAVA